MPRIDQVNVQVIVQSVVIGTITARPIPIDLPDLIRYPWWGAEVGTYDIYISHGRHIPTPLRVVF